MLLLGYLLQFRLHFIRYSDSDQFHDIGIVDFLLTDNVNFVYIIL
jgi:hypothetical protein